MGNGGSLLANTDVDTHESILDALGLLVNDGIDGDSGLAGLTITDDQLTLSTSNRDEGIHGLEASGHGLMYRFTGNDTGGLHLGTRATSGVDGTLAIDGLAKTIDHTTKELRANGHIHNRSSTLHGIPLKNGSVITEDHNTDVGVLQVQGHSTKASRKDNHLSSLYLVQTVHTGNTITHTDHLANLIERSGRSSVL